MVMEWACHCHSLRWISGNGVVMFVFCGSVKETPCRYQQELWVYKKVIPRSGVFDVSSSCFLSCC